MGLAYISADLSNNQREVLDLSLLVDSGATYSLLPPKIWKKLGLLPRRSVTVILADGTRLSREVSDCTIRMNGVEGCTPVLVGLEEDQEALLGAVTLENLGFVLDPFKRVLRPMQARL